MEKETTEEKRNEMKETGSINSISLGYWIKIIGNF